MGVSQDGGTSAHGFPFGSPFEPTPKGYRASNQVKPTGNPRIASQRVTPKEVHALVGRLVPRVEACRVLVVVVGLTVSQERELRAPMTDLAKYQIQKLGK